MTDTAAAAAVTRPHPLMTPRAAGGFAAEIGGSR